MQTHIEHLQTQIEHLRQFEALFASENYTEFNDRLAAFKQYMAEKFSETAKSAFEDFNFTDLDGRIEATKTCFTSLQGLTSNNTMLGLLVGNRAANFFDHSIRETQKYFQVLAAKQAAKEEELANPPTGMMSYLTPVINNMADSLDTLITNEAVQKSLLNNTRILIHLQKLNLENALQTAQDEIRAQTIAKQIEAATEAAQAHSASTAKQIALSTLRRKYMSYGAGAAIAITTGALAYFGIAKYNPHLLMLMSTHLPAIALVAAGAAGVTLAAYLVYRAYQARTQIADASVPVPTEYSKRLTAMLMGAGASLVSFSALIQFSPQLMQFSPKFALLMGLHLPQAAVIAMTIMGTLLMAIAFYRVYKAYQANVVATPATAVGQPTCTQRISQSLSCCFKFGGNVNAAPASELSPVATSAATV